MQYNIRQMEVMVFGNPDFEPDSLPIRLMPELRCRLPAIDFINIDPNEEWTMSGDIIVIDTALNLNEPRVFVSLDAFESAPNVSMHDFDALANLRLMQKLGKIGAVRVIALPPNVEPSAALDFIEKSLRA